MGCHTWFYRKSDLKIEKARERVVKSLDDSISFNKKLIIFYNNIGLEADKIFDDKNSHDYHYTTKEVYDEYVKIFGDASYLPLIKACPEWYKSNVEHFINLYTRQIRMIKKGLCNHAVYNKLPEVNHYIPKKDAYYVTVDIYHDLFRVYGYPRKKLFSYDETIAYIEEMKDNRSVYDWTYTRLREFWEEHPDGMIDFG